MLYLKVTARWCKRTCEYSRYNSCISIGEVHFIRFCFHGSFVWDVCIVHAHRKTTCLWFNIESTHCFIWSNHFCGSTTWLIKFDLRHIKDLVATDVEKILFTRKGFKLTHAQIWIWFAYKSCGDTGNNKQTQEKKSPLRCTLSLLFSHGKKLDTTQRGASQGGFLLLGLFIW